MEKQFLQMKHKKKFAIYFSFEKKVYLLITYGKIPNLQLKTPQISRFVEAIDSHIFAVVSLQESNFHTWHIQWTLQ